MKRSLLIICSLIVTMQMVAADGDSIHVSKPLLSRIASGVGRLFDIDTAYIEPSHYNMQVYLTNNYTYEEYRLTDNNGNSIRFKPKPSLKIGPYFSYKFAIIGWTFDVLHLNRKNNRTELDFSFSTQPLGFDFFYRKSGNDYTINDITINGIDTSPMEGAPFKGLNSSVVGLNMYYIFNHRKFSHPSAFSKTYRQKRSCGSPLAGIGFTRHSLNIDWQDLERIARAELDGPILENMGQALQFEKVTYTDFSISGGYGYNWVFAKNMQVAASLSVALSNKRSISDSKQLFDAIGESLDFSDFRFSDITIDATGRLGFVWTDDHWFAGTNAVMHSYNYSRPNFYTNNIFGSINIFVGMNFVVKNRFRKKKK